MHDKMCTCIRCGSTENLLMMAHKVEGKIIGWIFACEDCEEAVKGAELQVHYGVKKGKVG